MQRASWLAIAVSILGCGRAAPPSGDAGVEPSPMRAAIARVEPWAPMVSARKPLRTVAGTFVPDGRGTLDVRLPAHADGSVHLAVAGRSDFDVEIRTAGAHEPLRLDRDVLVGTGVAMVAGADFVEDVRVLEAGAPRVVEIDLRFGAGFAGVRAREHRIELYDADGYVQVATAPVFAVDARGERKLLDVTITQSHATIRVPDDLVAPIVVDPLWSTRASAVGTHYSRPGILLPNGKVFTYAGVTYAEVYDPTSNTWHDVGLPTPADQGSLLAPLNDGNVLIIGGTSTNAVSRFDYATETFTSLPNPINYPIAPNSYVATISDGRALKWSGNTALREFETFTPSTGVWAKPTAPAGYPSGPAVQLDDGRVLMYPNNSYGGSLWNPTTGAWTTTSSTTYRHSSHTLTKLKDGRVLLLDRSYTNNNVGEIYDPATDKWKVTGKTAYNRESHAAVRLPNGRVLVSGGTDGTNTLSTVELYDPVADTWSLMDPMPSTRKQHSMVLMPSGNVFLLNGVGGPGDPPIQQTWLYSPIPNGSPCTSGAACASGFCTEGVCCASATCASGSTCAYPGRAGTCLKNVGQACGASSECGSGFCVDGVCCSSACDGQCGACNLAGKVGSCSAVKGAPVGGRAACPAGGSTTCSKYTCDGVSSGGCVLAPSTTACNADACASGVETHASFCDGAGACADVSKICAPYACGGKTCKTSCTTAADCAAGAYCRTSDNTCIGAEPKGKPCDAGVSCATGLTCVDGVCCAASACDAGSTCAAPGHEGDCFKKNGTTCGADTECGSGHCADGVCCDTACTGQCEACNETEPGKCVPVTGAPRGTSRKACDAFTGDEICRTRACDGKDTTSCAGFVSSATSCRKASCDAGVFTSSAVCDGAGNCPEKTTNTCDGYACNSEGTACRTSCTEQANCLSGYLCKEGVCKKQVAKCSEDRRQSIPLEGDPVPCDPYLCATDTCMQACANSSDCAPGFVCDGSKCVGAAPEGDSGGCAVGRPVRAMFAGAFALVLLGVVTRRRRVTSRGTRPRSPRAP